MMLAVAIILLIISVILNLWLIYQKVKTEENLIKIGNDFSELRQSLMEERNKYSKLNGQYQQLNIYYGHLKDEKNKIANELYALKTNLLEQEHQQVLADELNAQIEELYKLVDDKKVELANLSSTAAEILLNEQTKLAHIKELELSIKEAERRNLEVENKYDDLMAAIGLVKKELDNLTHLKNSVLAIEEGNGHQWSFSLTDEKKRFVTLIETLIREYGAAISELRTGLAKIEWSNVWLPQVQQLCSREGLDGRGGIYRLTSKTDERICYIGQAVNIKDRWYTHIKKMVGVEARGSERLYEYRPDELTWEVVEFKDGNLDSDEKYWIDYYKCREIGLNKKR